MKRVSRFDMLIYRLFYWRWNKILRNRPDLRKIILSWMKAYDDSNEGEEVKVKVIIEKMIKETE